MPGPANGLNALSSMDDLVIVTQWSPQNEDNCVFCECVSRIEQVIRISSIYSEAMPDVSRRRKFFGEFV